MDIYTTLIAGRYSSEIVLLALAVGILIGVVISNIQNRRLDGQLQRRGDLPLKGAAHDRAARGSAAGIDSADELSEHAGRLEAAARLRSHGCAD